jgi:ABC-type bacteriocin/lantibiotic exporter with double-glycine peptidase domain
MIPGMGAALGCLERIQKYLDIEERPDFREVQPSTRQSPSNGSDDEKAGGGSRSEGGKAMISITGASYSWTTTSRPVLKNVSLSIRRGEHIAVTGQVGSGKFLFLNAILGEAVQPEGSTTISTAEISYCAQTPWLENLSGIKTVLRSAECDVAWLKSVTWACALEDVKGLKEYAEGSIGTGGMILSGGQKQRLVSCNSPSSPEPSV